MSTTETPADSLLTGDVLAHLNTQLESARRMLSIVLEQAAAIRQRAVPTIVKLAGALQVEIHRRETIEAERLSLLQRASVKLAVSAQDISMSMLAGMMDSDSAALARQRQAELRGLLEEIQREHHTNRALMQQELAFLDHLLQLAGSAGGYNAGGGRASAGKTTRIMRRPVFEMDA